MGRELGDSNMGDVCFEYYGNRSALAKQADKDLEGVPRLEARHLADWDLREPSTSFLLKQLLIMRRFSSSNRSALLAAAPGPPPFARSIRSRGMES